MLVVVPNLAIAINMLRFERMYPRVPHGIKGLELVVNYIDQDNKFAELVLPMGDNASMVKSVYDTILKQLSQIEDGRVTTELENAIRNSDAGSRS